MLFNGRLEEQVLQHTHTLFLFVPSPFAKPPPHLNLMSSNVEVQVSHGARVSRARSSHHLDHCPLSLSTEDLKKKKN